MKKIIIATHSNLAIGFKDTLEYLAPNVVEIVTISAYVNGCDLEREILKKLKSNDDNEQLFVFTDLLGGSVNQEFTKKLSKFNFELITGVSLPLILDIALKSKNNYLTSEDIKNSIEASRQQIVYVNEQPTKDLIESMDE